MHFVCFGFEPAEVALNAIPGFWPLVLVILAVIGVAIDNPVLPFLGKLFERDITRDFVMTAHSEQIRLRFSAVAGLPGFDRSFGESLRTIGKREVVINCDGSAEAATRR